MFRGIRLAPSDVALLLAPDGFQDDIPAVTLRLPSPSVARPPKALPFPRSALGLPKSPLIVTPVPPFGLFHTGIPAHCAPAGAATAAANAKTVRARFMTESSKGGWFEAPGEESRHRKCMRVASMHPHGTDRHTLHVPKTCRDPGIKGPAQPEIGAESQRKEDIAAPVHGEKHRRLHVGDDADVRALRVDAPAERQADRHDQLRAAAHELPAHAQH